MLVIPTRQGELFFGWRTGIEPAIQRSQRRSFTMLDHTTIDKSFAAKTRA